MSILKIYIGSRLRIFDVVGLMLLSAAITGCAVQSPPAVDLRVPMRAYSFVPPAGWESIRRLSSTKAEYADRKGDTVWWARAYSLEVGNERDATDPDKVLRSAYSTITHDQMNGLGNDTQLVAADIHTEGIAGAACMRSRAVFKNKSIVALQMTLVCTHPEWAPYIVVLDSMQRRPEQSDVSADLLVTDRFLNSLRFGPLVGLSDITVSARADTHSSRLYAGRDKDYLPLRFGSAD